MRIKQAIMLGVASLALLSVPALADKLSELQPVTDESLQNVAPGNWLAYGRDVNNYGFSPLTQITPDNVDSLQLVWARGIDAGQGSKPEEKT